MRRGSSGALVARYRSLQDPRVRRQSGQFVAEGIRCLIVALEARARVVELAWCRSLLRSARGKQAVREMQRAGVPSHQVDEGKFHALSGQQHASGVAMILRQRWIPLPRLPPGSTPVHLAVRQIRNPGNLGTLLRSLEAVDGGALITLGPGTDPFSPDVLRGSMGALLRRPVARTDDAALRRWAQGRGIRIVGASPGAGDSYDHGALRGPVVLLLGEERRGLGPRDESLCDGFVHIPILGSVDSLNLGVAGSLLLYEALRAAQAPA